MMKLRHLQNRVFKGITFSVTLLSWLLLLAFFLGLIIQSRGILSTNSLKDLLFTSSWAPARGQFGFFPFIMGTLWVTAIAILLAAPVCILCAIYLCEYAPRRLRDMFRPVIDLLAGIPSVVYGLWGVLLIVPLVKKYLAPVFGINSSGYTLLSGGIVLAVMISPVIINITMEVLHAIPRQTRESALSLGATRWQAVKITAFRRGLSGIMAGVVMAVSRAFGETMAVLMVAGNVVKIPGSVFDPGYPLPALIANSYGEMLSVPQFQSALLFASLVLMIIVILFNISSYLILTRMEENYQ